MDIVLYTEGNTRGEDLPVVSGCGMALRAMTTVGHGVSDAVALNFGGNSLQMQIWSPAPRSQI